jgi:Zn-dependent peptidase ImmA (M78 family)
VRRSLLLQNTPPEWNVRVLTQDDFDYYCDRAGIIVSETQLEQPGWYVCSHGQPQIFLNDQLRGPERLFVGFHELAHHWLHPPGVRMFYGWARDLEIEADIVAVCCLIPKTVLTHYWPSEIAEIYGYPHDLVGLRCEVFDRYKI